MLLRRLSFLLSLLVCLQAAVFAQVKAGDAYPDWTTGYMDIHHINTGRGECVFAILPDGTTLMIDAGNSNSPARPDDSRSAGEWITRYILHMMRPLPDKKLDYIFLTHFDGDHIGSVHEVGDNIPFSKIVDRNWPDYNFPRPMSNNRSMQNYIGFVNRHIAGGAIAEQFQVGSNRQFTLLRQADKYPEFEIRNLAANGVVWTGVHNNVRNHFPPIESISAAEFPGENQCSAAIRISYGRFDYFNGGDIVHSSAPGTWRDIETPVGQIAGPVDVCEVNHHAVYDAMGEAFLKAVRPSVFIIQALGAGHPDNRGLQRMMAQWIYPGERDIFTTNLRESTREVVGVQRANQMKSQQGHIVVRVLPGGDRYNIYILDDSAENFTIKSIHGPYESN